MVGGNIICDALENVFTEHDFSNMQLDRLIGRFEQKFIQSSLVLW